jgi:uncharacterized membrane protein YedE/YeeE
VLPALASGLLFSLGLTVSQMINPAKVIGLLDVFGDWDPNLAFVMATAIPVTVAGYGCKTAPIAALCFGLHSTHPNEDRSSSDGGCCSFRRGLLDETGFEPSVPIANQHPNR